MKLFKNDAKKVLIQCPYATEASKDFCKPYILDMNSPDFQNLMESHVAQHMERDSALLGLTIKRFGCPICDWESKPFQSNNAVKLKVLGREEMEAMIDLEDHITGNSERVENLRKSLDLMKSMRQIAEAEQDLEKRSDMLQQLTELGDEKTFEQLIEDYRGHETCILHETPGHELLTYYFRDKEEKALHTKLLHQPTIKPVNPKLKR